MRANGAVQGWPDSCVEQSLAKVKDTKRRPRPGRCQQKAAHWSEKGKGQGVASADPAGDNALHAGCLIAVGSQH